MDFIEAFTDEIAALKSARVLFRSRVQPAICEFLDRESVLCAERATGKTVFPGQEGRPVILLEFAGSVSEIEDVKAGVLAWARSEALAFKEAAL